MIAALALPVVFLVCYAAARRRLALGVAALLSVGYVYGIVRANFPGSVGLFLFDCGLLGLYAAAARRITDAVEQQRLTGLRAWLIVLCVWPLLMALVPFQPALVTLAGLRANLLLLPLCWFGALLSDDDLSLLGHVLAWLNMIALVFGVAEYFYGLQMFFPEDSPLSALIYMSRDVAGYKFHRIPATFSSAHAYGGTMMTSLPLLLGAVALPNITKRTKLLLGCGIAAAMTGVLLCSARMHFVLTGVISLAAIFSGGLGMKKRLLAVAAMSTLAVVAMQNPRLQRFTSLQDTAAVEERISWSVNRDLWEILIEFPFGNGIGGGGTNMPSFLQGAVREPVSIENEYARIQLEQGLMGLFLWVCFVAWFFVGSYAFQPSPWRFGRRLMWLCCACQFIAGLIGTGLFTSIPQSALMLMQIGIVLTPPRTQPRPRNTEGGGLRPRSSVSYA